MKSAAIEARVCLSEGGGDVAAAAVAVIDAPGLYIRKRTPCSHAEAAACFLLTHTHTQALYLWRVETSEVTPRRRRRRTNEVQIAWQSRSDTPEIRLAYIGYRRAAWHGARRQP